MWTRWIRRTKEMWLDRPLAPGTKVGHWRIVRLLGEGSYGIAYLGVEPDAGRQVVVKQVRPSRAGGGRGLALLENEKRALQSLSHPRIPQVLGEVTDPSGTYLILTYIPGPTVEQLLFDHHTRFSEQASALMVRKLSGILRELHARGIVHRDVRIPNVIIRDGEPHLIDFGLARFVGDPAPAEPQRTDFYPSAKRLARRIHPASDLYALGHFLLFLLYSDYTPQECAPERSWEDELTLTPAVRLMLRRLLELDQPYPEIDAFLADLDAYLASTVFAPFERNAPPFPHNPVN